MHSLNIRQNCEYTLSHSVMCLLKSQCIGSVLSVLSVLSVCQSSWEIVYVGFSGVEFIKLLELLDEFVTAEARVPGCNVCHTSGRQWRPDNSID